MSIADQIEAIIEKRQNQAKKINSVKQELLARKQAIEQLEDYRQYLQGKSNENTNLGERLEKVNFAQALEQIDHELTELSNIQKRLSRPTLNIGVVGRMRQGKSRLLQSLTGLEDEHIPTSDQGVCTRGLSKIFHEDNSNQVKNQIKFHDWSSFKEIIHLYFDQLELPGSKPMSTFDFGEGKRPPFLPASKKNDPNAKFLYGRLSKEYYGKFENYQPLLNGSTIEIPTAEILKYITEGDSSNGEYLAVQELNIRCQFPHPEDVGKIGVVDLPGLGDDSIFDVQRLIKALQEDIDFILFVRMPNATGDDWQETDRTMYKTAREALGDFPLSQCSFMVLNRLNEGNLDNLRLCERFQKTISNSYINVKDSVIADCSDEQEVSEKVLTPVLNYLTNNIESVYEQYLRSRDKNLAKLRQEIGEILTVAENTIHKVGKEDFIIWFDNTLWEELPTSIFKLQGDLNAKKNQKDEDFEKKIEQVLVNCRSEEIIPSIGAIERRRGSTGNSYKIAYYTFLNDINSKLSNQFKELAKFLSKRLEYTQSLVRDILIEYGNLDKLTDKQGNAFFQDLEAKLKLSENTSKLAEGFREIQNSINVDENIINNWIKDHLAHLAPDENIDPISELQVKKGKINKNKSDQVSSSEVESIGADSIRNALDSRRNEIVQLCEQTLMNKLSEPNQIALSMVQKFATQVFASKQEESQWRMFMEKHEEVWPGAENMKNFETDQQTWQNLVKSAMAANDQDR